MSRWDSWDESRVRVRPNKKGSRPRTKETPDYSDAELARVLQVDRGRYLCSLMADESPLTAVRAKALRRTPVVPGDLVRLVGDTSGEEGTLARLVHIEDRRTLLRRSSDDEGAVEERVIVANVDQLLIVVAAANPEPRTGFIDRALVAAYEAVIEPILLITKTDLADPGELIQHYEQLDLTILTSAHVDQEAVDRLTELLTGKVTALIGHSGVGKSTVVNALTGADRATGGVNAITGRGRHTSSSAVALSLPAGGWVIDTPGVRSFGLAHIDPDDVLAAFEDLAPGSAECESNCAHLSAEGGCALDAYVDAGNAGQNGPARLKSLRGLLQSLG